MRTLKILLKKSIALFIALIMIVGIFPFMSLPAYAEGEQQVTDVYLTFDQDGFDKFQIGTAEGVADGQLRNLIQVKPGEESKYIFDRSNSGLGIYYVSGEHPYGVGDGTALIDAEKDYTIGYNIKPKAGYLFSTDVSEMNFYVNGVKVTPIFSFYNPAWNTWKFYLLAGSPAPKPEISFIENVNVTGIAEPLEGGSPANTTDYTNTSYDVGNLTWSSTNDTSFASDNIFKVGKKYTVTTKLTPKEGFKFKANDTDPSVFAGTAKVNDKNADSAINSDTGEMSLSYTFPTIPEEINDIYLTFDKDNFSNYQIGQTEGSAEKQFKNLITVNPGEESKYYINGNDSGLGIYHGSGQPYGIAGGTDPINEDKDYQLKYTIYPKEGYGFSTNIGGMNFYVNGVKVTPTYEEYNTTWKSWKFYVPAGTPAPKPVITTIDEAKITGIIEPKIGNASVDTTSYVSDKFDVGNLVWSSPNDLTFGVDKTFKEGKTYSVSTALTPKTDHVFKSLSGNPSVFDGIAKINTHNANATIDPDTGKMTLSYTFNRLPVKVSRVDLTFAKEDFDIFLTGETEGDANQQYKSLIAVKPGEEPKYTLDTNRSNLNYIKDSGSMYNVGNDTDLIFTDKEYYVSFFLEPSEGRIFESDINSMSFYINGEKVNPTKSQYNGYLGTWEIFIPVQPELKYKLKAQTGTKVKLYGYDDAYLSWTRQTVAGAQVKYKVEYRKSTWANYIVLSNGTTANYFKRSNLADGAKYRFRVTPFVEEDGLKYYGTTQYTPYIYALKKLTTPRLSKYSKYYVRVRWTNIYGESGYQIARSRYKTKKFSVVKTASYKYSSATVKTTRNRTYYYKVRAYKTVSGKRIYGPWSAVRAYKLR